MIVVYNGIIRKDALSRLIIYGFITFFDKLILPPPGGRKHLT